MTLLGPRDATMFVEGAEELLKINGQQRRGEVDFNKIHFCTDALSAAKDKETLKLLSRAYVNSGIVARVRNNDHVVQMRNALVKALRSPCATSVNDKKTAIALFKALGDLLENPTSAAATSEAEQHVSA